MKQMFATLLFLLGFVSTAFAQDAGGIDAAINAVIQPITNVVASVIFYSVTLFGAKIPLVVVWLVVGAIFCTIYFRFINIRGFLHALALVRGDYDDPDDTGEVSHFQALSTAVSGTVGIGNIGGVPVAIAIGGPGATFWMIVAGLLGMSTKFVECVLGVKYRDEFEDGHVSGGPMYYLKKGLAEHGWVRLGKALGVFYAVGIFIGCLGIGNMWQSNQAFMQFVEVTGGEQSWFADKGWLFGIAFAVVVGAVILGGIKTIAKVTEKVVPFMGILYLVSGLIIIGMNYEGLGYAFHAIFTGAFRAPAVVGGAVGAMIVGFQRAAFSNEAGLGSAAIAHSAVRTNEPVTEGIVALLEPFVDTIVICTVTALVIITTGYFVPDFTQSFGAGAGIQMSSAAFERNISWSPYVIAVAAILFAFSTTISWAYYGLKGWTYLVGESRLADISYKCFFCVFVAMGAMIQLGAVLDFSDAMVFIICIPNLIGLYVLAPGVKKDLTSYFARIDSGEIKNFRKLRLQAGSRHQAPDMEGAQVLDR